MTTRAPTGTVLLTGATGHVGTSLLPRLLAEPDTRVLALVRAKDDAHLLERRDALRARVPGVDPSRLDVVRGDVSAPGLGLSDGDRDRVDAEVTSLIHSAASVRFDMPQEKAAGENIDSTRAMLALARRLADRGRLLRHDHVSTAYVAGDRAGRVLETEADVGQGFRNSYEWSKCQAEGHVRAAIAEGLPVAIHRPSIIVGDSETGATESFNVLYWPLMLYARGWWRLFPGRADTLVDIVPVDFVADALVALRRTPATIGSCFHLTAGDDAPRVDALGARFAELLDRPPLRTIDPDFYLRWVRPVIRRPLSLTKRGRRILRGGSAYLPYFRGNPLFDTTNLRLHLGRGAPSVFDYVERIARYAKEKDFGGR
ncbi:MAG: SDR family oxidoreductase [Pseudomonadota bacterium]|nr:SDR family oxidoreductase [Pseudomonadota bacterium]